MIGHNKAFNSVDDVLLALDAEAIETQTKIRLRWKGDLIDLTLEHNTQDVMRATVREDLNQVIETTAGRVILNERLTRDGLPFITNAQEERPSVAGQLFTLETWPRSDGCIARRSKSVGFLYATKSGMSIGIDDMVRRRAKRHIEDAVRKSISFRSSTKTRP